MEQVLVVDADALCALLRGNGLQTEGTDEILALIHQKHRYCRRDAAETSDAVKQVIPYAVLRRADEVFLLVRLNQQTEKRLHGKLSIGIGGHINPDAEAAGDPVEYGLYKELREEVRVDSIENVRYLGVIHDASTPVGRCHVGLLYEIWVGGDVLVLEAEKMSGQWQTLARAKDRFDEMETWSQLALEHILAQ